MRTISCRCSSFGSLEDRLFHLVDPVVVVFQRREEAVREAVEQAVEDDDRPLELAGPLRV